MRFLQLFVDAQALIGKPERLISLLKFTHIFLLYSIFVSMEDVKLVTLPSSPNTTASLSLLNDLSIPVRGDKCTFHFEVLGISLEEGKGHLKVLIDNDNMMKFHTQVCHVEGLSDGYHLLRAFVVDETHGGQCIKLPQCYVEAEFHVNEIKTSPGPRPFFFGQVSLCHILPRPNVSRQSSLNDDGVFCDIYAHNCEVSNAPHGFSVRVYVNEKAIGDIKERQAAFRVTGLKKERAKFRFALIDPAGTECSLPAYSTEAHIYAPPK